VVPHLVCMLQRDNYTPSSIMTLVGAWGMQLWFRVRAATKHILFSDIIPTATNVYHPSSYASIAPYERTRTGRSSRFRHGTKNYLEILAVWPFSG
jgi:hypothetical protein